MMKAVRFATVNTVAEAVADMLYTAAMEAQLENERILRELEEQEWAERYFGRNSRARWLMDNEGLSLVEAAYCVQAEEEQWEREGWELIHRMDADAAAGKEVDWSFYSDVYKDLTGVRPRW